MNFIVILLLGMIALVSGCKSPGRTTTDSSGSPVLSALRTTNSFTIITPTNSPAGFRHYVEAVSTTIEERWHGLLAQLSYDETIRGKVVLRFRLHSDGRVTDIEDVERTVSFMLSLLCQKAVQDPAPYKAWPPGMREMVGRDFHELTCEFHYNMSPKATPGKR